jgi:PAS domain S-box-containing protein
MGTDPATEDPSPVEHMSEGDQLRLLVGSVRDYAILGLDVGGSVISWNAGAELIKGYRAEEIIGRHFSVFYPREDIDSGKPAAELVEATRLGRFEDEGWRLRKDGTRFWANVVITALFDDQGHLRGFGKVTRDITERRRSEEAFHEARAFQEALLVASPAIISLLDPATGSTVWASRSVLDLLGYEPAQIIEMGPEMVPLIIHPADVDGYLQANAQVARLDPGAALELRHRVQRFDGTQLWFLRRMTPFRHADGRALVLSVSTAPRRPDRPAQPGAPPRPPRTGGGPGRAGWAGGRAHDRSRRLQGDQRPVRPLRRGPGARCGCGSAAFPGPAG